jgi:hypothetical protein
VGVCAGGVAGVGFVIHHLLRGGRVNKIERIFDVSKGMFSIARHYGGIKFNGDTYIYNPTNDTLTRQDIHLKEQKGQKAKEKELKDIEHRKQLALDALWAWGEQKKGGVRAR